MVAARTAALLAPAVLWGLAAAANAQDDGDGGRRIEEVVVTAEKRESTVSDTSISITAFGEQMIAEYGIQSPDELVNFIPATTRDPYDIRIRGVGRNFRALGGDRASPPTTTASTPRTLALPPPRTRSTTSSGWRCCAGRRARCTDATPSAAR